MNTTLAPPSAPSAPSAPDDTSDPIPVPEPQRPTERPVTFAGVVRSEWVKLRSVRSSTTTLLATAGVLLFFGAIATALSSGLLTEATPDGGGGPTGSDPTSIAMTGILFAPLIVGVLGVMVMTSEYATGTIRSTMTLVPKRLPVLWAKAAVLTAVTLPVMVIATLATFLSGQLLLGAGGAETASLGDPGVLRAVLDTAVYLSGVALLGLAAGALLRGTAVAVSVLFTLVFLLPGLGGFLLPLSWQENVLLYLPTNAASSFTSVTPGPELLSTATGAAVFAAWLVVPMIAAAVALKRRAV